MSELTNKLRLIAKENEEARWSEDMLSAIEELREAADEIDRLQAIVDRLPKCIVDKLSKHDTIKECQKESISPDSVLDD